VRTLLAALLVTLAAAAGAAAAIPSDLSDDPLDRGTLLALPSVYRVDVMLHVDALRTAAGDRVALPPGARGIPEAGAAVAVAPGGWLVTAAHVAAPDDATLARLAYQSFLAVRGEAHGDAAAEDWVERTGAVPVGARAVVTVTQADVGAGSTHSRSYPAVAVRRSETADLALIRIEDDTAPALELDEAASSGTPVVTIGFGRGSTLDGPEPGKMEPSIRRGTINRVGNLDDAAGSRQAILISVPVERGDSGGPVIDAAGKVRGIVTLKTAHGGIAERATEVRRLLEENRIIPGAGHTAEAFQEAMDALRGLDLAPAETGFASTLASFPAHTLAGRERARTRELAASTFRLRAADRRQGVLLAVGVLALLAAAACAVAIARRSPGRSRRAAGGR
jgi:hypothetical protein